MATKTEQTTKPRWYSLATDGKRATLDIYGDITSWPCMDTDVSAASLSKQLEAIDAEEIEVGINSYGGEIGEGLAIYNALKRHPAKVTTRCDGFACSIASVIFMAGDSRIMSEQSMLMIHNGWTVAEGDAAALRKQADDIEKLTEASVQIYMKHATIEESELRALMDAETWISPEEALDMGLATGIETDDAEKPAQSVRKKVMQMLRNPYRQATEDEDDPNRDPEDVTDGETTDDTTEDTGTDAPETTDATDETDATDTEPTDDDTATDDTTTEDPTPDDEDEQRKRDKRCDVVQLLTAISHM